MCEIWSDEAADVWTEVRRKARKSHRCMVCRAPILPGQTYGLHTTIWNGQVSAEKICGDCDSVRDRFEDAHGIQIAPSGLTDFLRDCFEEASRCEWTPEDKAWRRDLAGVLRRRRAAARAPVEKGEGP